MNTKNVLRILLFLKNSILLLIFLLIAHGCCACKHIAEPFNDWRNNLIKTNFREVKDYQFSVQNISELDQKLKDSEYTQIIGPNEIGDYLIKNPKSEQEFPVLKAIQNEESKLDIFMLSKKLHEPNTGEYILYGFALPATIGIIIFSGTVDVATFPIQAVTGMNCILNLRM